MRLASFVAPSLLLLGLTLGSGCDDSSSEGAGGAGGGGSGGEGGVSTTTGQGPAVTVGQGGTTGSGTPTRTASQICEDACACDPECVAAREVNVAGCVERFSSDASAAALASCTTEYQAYFLCFSNEWTCGSPGACDDVAEALGECVAVLCDRANELCGCFGCQSECRSAYERCTATCVVEAGSCGGEGDDLYACYDACYAQDSAGSSGSGF